MTDRRLIALARRGAKVAREGARFGCPNASLVAWSSTLNSDSPRARFRASLASLAMVFNEQLAPALARFGAAIGNLVTSWPALTIDLPSTSLYVTGYVDPLAGATHRLAMANLAHQRPSRVFLGVPVAAK